MFLCEMDEINDISMKKSFTRFSSCRRKIFTATDCYQGKAFQKKNKKVVKSFTSLYSALQTQANSPFPIKVHNFNSSNLILVMFFFKIIYCRR